MYFAQFQKSPKSLSQILWALDRALEDGSGSLLSLLAKPIRNAKSISRKTINLENGNTKGGGRRRRPPPFVGAAEGRPHFPTCMVFGKIDFLFRIGFARG